MGKFQGCLEWVRREADGAPVKKGDVGNCRQKAQWAPLPAYGGHSQGSGLQRGPQHLQVHSDGHLLQHHLSMCHHLPPDNNMSGCSSLSLQMDFKFFCWN